MGGVLDPDKIGGEKKGETLRIGAEKERRQKC